MPVTVAPPPAGEIDAGVIEEARRRQRRRRLGLSAVLAAVADAEPDVIMHQMTSLASMRGVRDFRRFDATFAATNDLRTRGTDYLLEAAQASGVKRFIAQSYIGWNNARTGDLVKSENDPLDPDPLPVTTQTMAAIRHVEDVVPEAGGIVLRYGSFYGPGASVAMLDAVRKRQMPVIGSGAGVWSFTEVTDAAGAADATAVSPSAADEARVLAEYEGSLPGLEAAFAQSAERAAQALVGRRALDARRVELAETRQRTELVAAGLAERQRVLTGRLAEVERRLSGHGEEREAAQARREDGDQAGSGTHGFLHPHRSGTPPTFRAILIRTRAMSRGGAWARRRGRAAAAGGQPEASFDSTGGGLGRARFG